VQVASRNLGPIGEFQRHSEFFLKCNQVTHVLEYIDFNYLIITVDGAKFKITAHSYEAFFIFLSHNRHLASKIFKSGNKPMKKNK
jgi:hypothetical protein